MNCCNCNKEIPDGSEFCNFCGSKQEEKLFCNNCGRELPIDSEFCQYCRTPVNKPDHIKEFSKKSPIIQNKRSNNKLIPVLIIAAVVIVLSIVAVIFFTGGENKSSSSSEEASSKTEEETKTESFESMDIEGKMSASQYISLSDFKDNENYLALTGQNLHFSGYVIEDEWDQHTGITIAESQEWPFDFSNEIEYYERNYNGSVTDLIHEPPEIQDRIEAEFDALPKTTTVYVKLDEGGQAVKRPLKGDFVDVYFMGDGRIRALAYSIVVR